MKYLVLMCFCCFALPACHRTYPTIRYDADGYFNIYGGMAIKPPSQKRLGVFLDNWKVVNFSKEYSSTCKGYVMGQDDHPDLLLQHDLTDGVILVNVIDLDPDDEMKKMPVFIERLAGNLSGEKTSIAGSIWVEGMQGKMLVKMESEQVESQIVEIEEKPVDGFEAVRATIHLTPPGDTIPKREGFIDVLLVRKRGFFIREGYPVLTTAVVVAAYLNSGNYFEEYRKDFDRFLELIDWKIFSKFSKQEIKDIFGKKACAP